MDRDIYDPAFVADLFDRCSARYRWWSTVSSFGFVGLWRRACVKRLQGQAQIGRIQNGEISAPNAPLPRVLDLMAGTGEVWPHVLNRFPRAQITALDLSPAMHAAAVERLHGSHAPHITHQTADALTQKLDADSADLVISTFGLKTLTQAGQDRLAAQIAHVLRPGGAYAVIEASDPKGWVLRPLYRLYLDAILPMLERLFLRGAQDFSMIGTYTRNFGDCAHFAQALRNHGLLAVEQRHVFGCATSVAGIKPLSAENG